MKKKSYTSEVSKLIPLIGGKDNIVSYTHCVSRIRLILHNNSKIDLQAIEALDNIKGIVQPLG